MAATGTPSPNRGDRSREHSPARSDASPARGTGRSDASNAPGSTSVHRSGALNAASRLELAVEGTRLGFAPSFLKSTPVSSSGSAAGRLAPRSVANTTSCPRAWRNAPGDRHQSRRNRGRGVGRGCVGHGGGDATTARGLISAAQGLSTRAANPGGRGGRGGLRAVDHQRGEGRHAVGEHYPGAVGVGDEVAPDAVRWPTRGRRGCTRR